MELAGYAPDVSGCCVCGREEPEGPTLCLESGAVCCRGCRRPEQGTGAELDDASLAALRFGLNAPAKQMLGFRLEGGSLGLLGRAAERYLLRQAERGFPTLDYWNTLKNFEKMGAKS